MIGAIFAFAGSNLFFEPLDLVAKSLANKARSTSASGDIIVVGMDDYLERDQVAWPWTHNQIADAVEPVSYTHLTLPTTSRV